MKVQIVYLLLSFLVTAILGKIMIPLLKKLKVGQSEREDGPRSHLRKQGTPTMGGVMMMITIILFTAIACIMNTDKAFRISILSVGLATIGFGVVGFLDDFKKVVLKNTDGLSPKLKMLGLLIVSVIYTVFLVKYAGIGTEITIPFTDYQFVFPMWLYIPFTICVMLSATNAVNLTDGVDGLAGSICAIMGIAVAIISMKLGNVGISVFSCILVGSCLGFLIYNFHKAKIMMGDTGSLLLGGAISSMMIYLKNPFILLILAIIPILETLSVILQVIYFRRTGKRLFRMSPLHHHFELSGWRENKVVAVFSAVTLIASVISIMAI